jgi:hypothetical protein
VVATSARYTGPADPLTPCNKCGGPTYTFVSGSVWCPDEACEPGGHFVVRVAFERKPGLGPLPLSKRESKRTVRVPKAAPQPEWAPSTHDFVRSE